MLSKIFEKPRYMIAAVGGLVTLQATIFKIIEPSLFSTIAIVVGTVTVLASLHVEIREIFSNVFAYFERIKEQRTRLAEERERLEQLRIAVVKKTPNKDKTLTDELRILEADDDLPTLEADNRKRLISQKSEKNVTTGNMTTTDETRNLNLETAGAVAPAGFSVLFTSGCLTTLGFLLCLTGIGAIIGIPMFLAGAFGMFGAPLLGFLAVKGAGKARKATGIEAIKGECPWCGTVVSSLSNALGVDCPACRKRIVIRDRMYLKIE